MLGFAKKTDIPLGAARWLTVVAPDDPAGTELLLEPDDHPAVRDTEAKAPRAVRNALGQYRSLLAAAGFQLLRAVPTSSGAFLSEAIPGGSPDPR
jgi:hypothetical protein